MKKFIAMLKIQNGEYEHLKDTLITAKDSKEAYEVATDAAKNYYGDDDVEEIDGSFFQNGGEVAVSVSNVKQISLGDFKVLKKYISEY